MLSSTGVISLAAVTVALPAQAGARHAERMAVPAGPDAALAELLAGNKRFVAGEPRYGHNVVAAAATSGGQQPYAVVVGCIDSRVPLEAIFDQDFGSICVVRSGGHVLDRAVIGSVEFAVAELNVPLVVVLGHERCGAIAATIRTLHSGQRPYGALGYLVDSIAPAVLEAGADPARAVRTHVLRTVGRLRAMTGPIAAADGSVAVHGAVYDLDTGQVSLI